jgi:predicted lipid-binding transport protein (Tim44 family)
LNPSRSRTNLIATTFLPVLLAIPTAAAAQQVAPPEAQAWIDIATFSGMGMPMGGMSGMGGLGGMFGGKGAGGGNTFGNTRSMSAGRWVDVTVRARANPNLDAAQQAVPEGLPEPGAGTPHAEECAAGTRARRRRHQA